MRGKKNISILTTAILSDGRFSTLRAFSEQTGVSKETIRKAGMGQNVSLEMKALIAGILGKSQKKLFPTETSA